MQNETAVRCLLVPVAKHRCQLTLLCPKGAAGSNTSRRACHIACRSTYLTGCTCLMCASARTCHLNIPQSQLHCLKLLGHTFLMMSKHGLLQNLSENILQVTRFSPFNNVCHADLAISGLIWYTCMASLFVQAIVLSARFLVLFLC